MAIVKANVLIWTLHNDATIIIDQQWLVSVLVLWMVGGLDKVIK